MFFYWLYELFENCLLCQSYHLQILSPILEVVFFILWIPLLVSLQKLISLIRSLFILAFISIENIGMIMLRVMFLPILSSRSSMVFLTCSIFKSLNHSIFVYGVRVYFNFTTAFVEFIYQLYKKC